MKKISYSFGIIDLLHYGHINTLLRAKNDADLHIFGLVGDEAASKWMGAIVSNYDERKKVLENVKCIDKIVYQKTLDPLENLKELHLMYPNAKITLYHGDNWKIMPAEQYLKSIGGEIIFTEYYDKLGPEKIIQALNKRHYDNGKRSNLISTKANTLLSLKDKLKKSKIEDILIVTVGEFEQDPLQIAQKVHELFKGKKIVVRSSSSNEDAFEESNAGHYESILHVDSSNAANVTVAIEKVINSYVKDSLLAKSEQILIQEQTVNVELSGVIFTRDIQQNRPYYLINYDDSGSTDSVTSGIGGKTVWISRDLILDDVDHKWRKVIESVKEIEEILDGMILDIEFATTQSDEVVIFQVRPLAANYKYSHQINEDDFFLLKENEKSIYSYSVLSKYENINMMLSDMAFWNPSEIIGSNPRNLDYSLYREIITRSAWNEGLVPMGYTEVNEDLMYKLGNKPYISLDYSFMSLIPDSLDSQLKLKLLNYYKKKLASDITAHDKIEFEVVFSCFDFETQEKLQQLLDHGFTQNEIEEIEQSVFELTNTAFANYFAILDRDLADLRTLNDYRMQFERDIPFQESNITKLRQYFIAIINYLKKYGTPQFSRQARFAFMAKSICRTMVNERHMHQGEMDAFMLSIETVASSFEQDFYLYQNKEITREDFNKKYGHLRSGTYDIRTPRYDQIDFAQNGSSPDRSKQPAMTFDQQRLENALALLGFKISPEQLVQVLKNAIEQREFFKFEFTKSLSLALEILALMGKRLNIGRNDLSYLEMPEILAAKYYQTERDLQDFWMTIIEQRKRLHEEKTKLVLPEVIMGARDFDMIEIGLSRPNFITDKAVDGQVALLEEDMNADIEGKIVVITKADPGFDWIFAKGIKGLITKYGGVASHMAIRCAEFGIPAAIGCGEKIYNFVSRMHEVKLDCKNKKISMG